MSDSRKPASDAAPESSEQTGSQKTSTTGAPQGETSQPQPSGKAEQQPTPTKTAAKKPAEKKPAEKKPAEKSTSGRGAKDGDTNAAAAAGKAVRSARSTLASAIWVVAVVAALLLAAGALVVTLNFNPDNSLVTFLTDTAERLYLLDNDLKTFEPDGRGADAQQSARTKTVLVNWGIAAIGYLVVGKVAERLVRP